MKTRLLAVGLILLMIMSIGMVSANDYYSSLWDDQYWEKANKWTKDPVKAWEDEYWEKINKWESGDTGYTTSTCSSLIMPQKNPHNGWFSPFIVRVIPIRVPNRAR